MMKLYFSPGACSLSVDIALHEAGVNFEAVKVDLMTHKLFANGEDFYQISPRGYVPVLQLDDGSRHTEAAALLQYVGDLAPKDTLIPAVGSLERLKVIEWLTFISTELHKGFAPLWKNDTAESTKQTAKEKLAHRFEELDQHFSNHSYLMGEKFTVADAYCFTIVNWSHLLKIDLKPYPHLSEFMTRIASRPKVQEALMAEGLMNH